MLERKEFRFPIKIELEIISKTLKEISKNLLSWFEKSQYSFIIRISDKSKILPHVYLSPKQILKPFKILNRENGDKIVSIGTYFGYIKRGELYLSIEAIEFLANRDLFPKKKNLILNTHGEKSILYGNDIQKNMIIKFPKNIKSGDLLLVRNNKGEVLALGRSLIKSSELISETRKTIAQNLIDKGYYLREEK